MDWDYRKFGTESDPVRQSDLNQFASQYACPKQFMYRKIASARGEQVTRDHAASGRVLGSAVHYAIEDLLTDRADRILAHDVPPLPELRARVSDKLGEASEGLPIHWGRHDRENELDAAAHMVHHACHGLALRADSIVAIEAKFFAPVHMEKRTYWTSGTIDILFRPKSDPSKLVVADWKTGLRRPHPIILKYGYQFGMYSNACEHGTFFPETTAQFQLEQHPAECWIVHLRDCVPYAKSTSRKITDPLDAAWCGASLEETVKFSAGDLRGPAWYPAHRTPQGQIRFKESVATIVSTIRLGRFVEFIGENCDRCEFKHQCLNDGEYISSDEQKTMNSILAKLESTIKSNQIKSGR